MRGPAQRRAADALTADALTRDALTREALTLPDGAVPGDPLFALDDVVVVRGAAEVLHRVTMTVAAGRCTVVVGPSGAGKSTLLRLFDRLEDPAAGELRLHGRPLASYDVLDLRRRVGLLQQQPVLLEDTVAADVRVGRPELDDAEVAALLGRVGLDAGFADRRTADLSGGEAQRVCLARALAVEPEVLLGDEPTSALDAFATDAVERSLRALVDDGLTVVVVSHDLAQARRLGDDAVVVVDGRVVEHGAAADVLDAPADPLARAFLAGVVT